MNVETLLIDAALFAVALLGGYLLNGLHRLNRIRRCLNEGKVSPRFGEAEITGSNGVLKVRRWVSAVGKETSFHAVYTWVPHPPKKPDVETPLTIADA